MILSRIFWALQRRAWGLGPSSVYQPGKTPPKRLLSFCRRFALVAVLAVYFTPGVVALPGCATIQARREVRRIDRECEAAFQAATTPAEAEAVHERCEARLEEVRHGED